MATHSSVLVWETHGQRSLVGYSPQGHKESDTTERLSMHASREKIDSQIDRSIYLHKRYIYIYLYTSPQRFIDTDREYKDIYCFRYIFPNLSLPPTEYHIVFLFLSPLKQQQQQQKNHHHRGYFSGISLFCYKILFLIYTVAE